MIEKRISCRLIGIGIYMQKADAEKTLKKMLEEEMPEIRKRVSLYHFKAMPEINLQNTNLDILIMDADLLTDGTLCGFREKRSGQREVKMICLARHGRFVEEAFKAGAYRYFEMDRYQEKLPEAVREAIAEILVSEGLFIQGKIFLKQNDIAKRGIFAKWVKYREIVYIECLGDEIVLYLENDTAVLLKESLSNFKSLLDRRFLQVHKSYCVNMDEIEYVGERFLKMNNRKEVPVSVRRMKEVRQAYQNYCVGTAG